MFTRLNLRSDLAPLEDAELARRLEQAWEAYDSAKKRFPWSGCLLWPPGRGPIRHPRVYRFTAVLACSSGSLLDLMLAIFLSGKRTERLIRSDRAADIYLSLCEVQDISDEIARRVGRRKQVNS